MMKTRKLIEDAAGKISDGVSLAIQRNVDGMLIAHAFDSDCEKLIVDCGDDYNLTGEVCEYYLNVRESVLDFAEAQAQYQVTQGATLH